ncbi:hypothetical protein IGI37_000216 [Enterococcus sp. AZ194]|uniref:hypothetical protein n=1 Tax=Enterococcus sp. AZ194 TaxID=2774629 RepID=UPI003F24EF1D
MKRSKSKRRPFKQLVVDYLTQRTISKQKFLGLVTISQQDVFETLVQKFAVAIGEVEGKVLIVDFHLSKGGKVAGISSLESHIWHNTYVDEVKARDFSHSLSEYRHFMDCKEMKTIYERYALVIFKFPENILDINPVLLSMTNDLIVFIDTANKLRRNDLKLINKQLKLLDFSWLSVVLVES